MIGRRGLLAAAALPLAAAGDPPGWPTAREIAFRVMRGDSVIGSHVLQFSRASGGFDVRIAVDIVVRFGPIAVFRYTLRGVEQWREGVVAHLSVDTDDDGTPASARADRDGSGLWVTGSKAARYLAPPDALPATHWNRSELKGPWINPQDGRLFRPFVSSSGMDRIVLRDGREVAARHFVLSGDVKMQLWYDLAQRWTGLLFTADDASEIRYELT